MSRLTDLYAQRDVLRSRRAALEAKIELLVPQETKVRLAINEAMKAEGKPGRGRGGQDVDSLDHVTRDDVPELFGQRTVD